MNEMNVLQKKMDAVLQSITDKKDYHQTKMMDVNIALTREWHESELNFYERKEKRIRDLIIRQDVFNIDCISEELEKTMDLER